MSAPVVEGSGEGIVDASSASDEEVRAALGVDASGDDDDSDDVPEGSAGDELTLESLAQIVEAQRVQIATLKREKAADRVAGQKAKVVPVATQTDEVAAAVEAAKAEARLEFGVKLAGASVKAALASVMTDTQIEAFVEDLNLARFVDDDGEVDADAIAALKTRQTALLKGRPVPKVGHGRQGVPGGKQSTADQFAEALEAALTH